MLGEDQLALCLIDVTDTNKRNLIMDAITRIDYLEKISMFSAFSQTQMYTLSKLMETIKFDKHEFIYRPKDESDQVYFLIAGTIKLGRYSSSNKEVIKSIKHPFAMFGEQAIFGEKNRDDFALVLDNEVMCFSISKDKFSNFISNNSDLAMNLIRNLGNKLKMAEKRYESLVVEDARTRIIDFLKYNAQEFGQRVGLEMLIKHSLTQQDIANFTGTSRQTVTSVMNDLKRTNQIFFKRKSILIRDINSLA